MRLTPLLGLFLLAGCAAEVADPADPTDESSEALSTTYNFRCANLTKDNGFDNVVYLRVNKSKVVWNQKSDFTSTAGAMTAKHDPSYHAKGSIPYLRYQYVQLWDKGGSTDHEWKLEPELVAGGAKMHGGDLGGFAIHGETVDAYGSTKYVCFRTK
jgi:hypothetical protein